MIGFEDIKAWLTAQGIDVPTLPGPDVPDAPDRLIIITLQPGAGFVVEQNMEMVAFQARIRGRQNDPADAQALAYDVDRAVCAASWPQTIGGLHVAVGTRTGGRPAPIGPLDSSRRQNWTGNYYFLAESGI